MMYQHYFRLMRFHKPIGIALLLWPTLWALWIAAHGFPSIKNLFIFVVGVVLMRAAGCVINDITDRKLDRYVTRTHDRPITTGVISVKKALILFSLLCAIAFVLVLFTNRLTIFLSFLACFFAILYPFTKRYTHWPQFVLGIAFSFSIPMAFAAETDTVPTLAIILMLANIAWTISYDTEYALTDRIDDIKIGIKSTAVLFGRYDRVMIGLFQLISVLLLVCVGLMLSYSWIYFITVFFAVLLMFYQQTLIMNRTPQKCLRAFLNNHWVGMVIFLGIIFR